ncbi:hypothetical protein [Streptomyces sp. R44]|uniref:Uncharacterized protein n=1 Tax=Streptomyces sp. R44 TaxID=3238633 RepID=A0AB39T550_9ACTN
MTNIDRHRLRNALPQNPTFRRSACDTSPLDVGRTASESLTQLTWAARVISAMLGWSTTQ